MAGACKEEKTTLKHLILCSITREISSSTYSKCLLLGKCSLYVKQVLSDEKEQESHFFPLTHFHWNCQRKEYFRSNVGSTGCIRNLPEKGICSKNRVGEPTFKVLLTNIFMPISLPKIIVVIPFHKKIMWLQRIIFY